MSFGSIIDSLWHNLSKVFVPTSVVGGLQITDSSIRYVELRPGGPAMHTVVVDKSLRLPPGVLEEGRIKDRNGFVAALKFLKHQISFNAKRNLNVVLTIPAGDVYVQTFSIPNLSGAALEEAVKLNLQVISPNPIDKTYYSWKIVGGMVKDVNQVEILGVFSLRETIDDLSSAVEEAGFGVAAIEFSSLSLVRILNSLKLIEKDVAYLLIKLTQDGLIFMIIKNGELYFNYFHSWGKASFENDNVSVAAVLDIIKTESQRVLNFYYSHLGGQINDVLLITAVLTDQIAGVIKSEYPNFGLKVVNSARNNFHGAWGAALRGLVPRIQDNDINLMGEKVVNAFWRDQIFSFVSVWRNTVLIVLGFMLVVFIASDLFLAKEIKNIREIAAISLKRPETSELAGLQAKVTEFNNLVAAALSARNLVNDVTPFLKKMNSMAIDNGITVSRLGLHAAALDVNLSGTARTQDQIIAFKNKLAALPQVSDVSLPLSGIVPDANRGFSFSTTFKLKTLNGF